MMAAWFIQGADRIHPWFCTPSMTLAGAFNAFVWALVASFVASVALWLVAAARCL